MSYSDGAPCELSRVCRAKIAGVSRDTALLYLDRTRTGRGGGRREKRRESPLLSAGSACYLFWKKCAPATPAHAALLHRGQVFQASRPPRERSRDDISRTFTEAPVAVARARNRESIVTWAAHPLHAPFRLPLDRGDPASVANFIHGDTRFSLPSADQRPPQLAHARPASRFPLYALVRARLYRYLVLC